MLGAGTLNRRVTIEQRTGSADTYGQPSTSWATLATVWASIVAPTGRAAAELLAADRETSPVAWSVRIRFRTDVTAGMRVVDGTTIYTIETVIPDMKGRVYVDLVCVTGAGEV